MQVTALFQKKNKLKPEMGVEVMNQLLLTAIMGVAVGDALGLPVQFNSREQCQKLNVTRMLDWELPKGTFSDDTATTLCTLDSLREHNWQLNEEDIMKRFVAWLGYGYMTCDDEAIDVGMATRKAIQRYYDGIPLSECGCRSFRECGNGSLMRIMPVVFYLQKNKQADLYDVVNKVSSLTHAHEVCVLGCYIYVSLCLEIIKLKNKSISKSSHNEILELLNEHLCIIRDKAKLYFSDEAMELYKRLFSFASFSRLSMDSINSSGFVVDSLEAALWCFATTDNFRDCLVKAVSLGEDTDSIAAIVGGMAALYYGYEAIPKEWISDLRGKDMIYQLCM